MMDDSEAYMNFAKTSSGSPSRDGVTSTYSELNIRKDKHLNDENEDPSVATGHRELPKTIQTDGLTSIYSLLSLPRDEPLDHDYEDPLIALAPAEESMAPQADGLTSTYTVLNLPKDERHIDENEDSPIASGPAELAVTSQAGPNKQELNEQIRIRPDCKICIFCLVTFVLFAIVVGLLIYVLQIPQSQITCDREEYYKMNRTQRQYQQQVHELNSTLESTISENSHLNLSQRTCLQNLSALNYNLSVLKRIYGDLRHQFTEMESKYRSVNETKAQICELLTSRREQACSQDWIRNEDRCYFISTFETSYNEARQYCSISASKLLEINSRGEELLVNRSFHEQKLSYWIGKCKGGEVAPFVLYTKSAGKYECGECKWYSELTLCNQARRHFICENSEPLSPDISEKFRNLCQQPEGPNSIK